MKRLLSLRPKTSGNCASSAWAGAVPRLANLQPAVEDHHVDPLSRQIYRYEDWLERQQKRREPVETSAGWALFFAADFAFLGTVFVFANAVFVGLAILAWAFASLGWAQRLHGAHASGAQKRSSTHAGMLLNGTQFLVAGGIFIAFASLATANLYVGVRQEEAVLTRRFIDTDTKKNGDEERFYSVEFATESGTRYKIRSEAFFNMDASRGTEKIVGRLSITKFEGNVVNVQIGSTTYSTIAAGGKAEDELTVLYLGGFVLIFGGFALRHWPRLRTWPSTAAARHPR